MSRFSKAAHDQEKHMAFGVKGDNYFVTAHKRMVLKAIQEWLSGANRDDTALHEALNDLEDMEGGGTSAMRQAINDIRFAVTLKDWEERDGYLGHIMPRIRGILKI